MLNRALAWGGLAAAATFLWTLGEYALGFHGPRAEVGRYSGFLAMLFPVAAISLAIRGLRDERGGLLFADGLKQGMATSLVAALLGALGTWAYFAWINPGFREAGRPVDGAGQAVLVLIFGLVLGLLVSTAATALLRRKVRTI